eukprot:768679-Hanusia_phi.AAC.4
MGRKTSSSAPPASADTHGECALNLENLYMHRQTPAHSIAFTEEEGADKDRQARSHPPLLPRCQQRREGAGARTRRSGSMQERKTISSVTGPTMRFLICTRTRLRRRQERQER